MSEWKYCHEHLCILHDGHLGRHVEMERSGTCASCDRLFIKIAQLEAQRTALDSAWEDLHDMTLTERDDARDRVIAVENERDEARAWVKRLTQEERTLTCVYCGHAYPPGSPDHGNQVLTDHIKVCTKHPLRATEAKILELEVRLASLTTVINAVIEHENDPYSYVSRNLQRAMMAMSEPMATCRCIDAVPVDPTHFTLVGAIAHSIRGCYEVPVVSATCPPHDYDESDGRCDKCGDEYITITDKVPPKEA